MMPTQITRRYFGANALEIFVLFLVLSSTFYLLRIFGTSIYLFDVLFFYGIFRFHRFFLVLDSRFTIALIAFLASFLISLMLAAFDVRPFSLQDAAVIFLRMLQAFLLLNFTLRVAASGLVRGGIVKYSVLIAIIFPLMFGLTVYLSKPEYVVVFNRYAGLFANPNGLAAFVVISQAVFVSCLVFFRFSLPASIGLSAVFYLLAISSLILSGSNSGIVLFLIGSSLIVARKGGASLLFIGLLMILVPFQDEVMALLKGWAYEIADSEFSGLKRTGLLALRLIDGDKLAEAGSGAYREQIKVFLIDAYLQSPMRILFGLGPGQSASLYSASFGDNVTIHNFYAMLPVEFGVFGVLTFCASLYFSIYRVGFRGFGFLIFSGYFLACLASPILYLPFYYFPAFVLFAFSRKCGSSSVVLASNVLTRRP